MAGIGQAMQRPGTSFSRPNGPKTSNSKGQMNNSHGSAMAVGAGGRMLNGPTGGYDIMSGFNQLLGNTMQNGMPTDPNRLSNAMNQQFNSAFEGRAANVKEQMGGLGARFSSDTGRAMMDTAAGTIAEQMRLMSEVNLQSDTAARGRQMQALTMAGAMPGQFQALSQNAWQNQRQPLVDAMTFATGFAPVGNTSRSKGMSASGGVM